MTVEPGAQPAIQALLTLMETLRHPTQGCAWDREQTFATIAPYTIEEAYEVADAIARDDLGDLKGELGDLLFQVVFHSRMAEEQGAFTFSDVAEAITTKMIARHPHVFGDAASRTADEQTVAWEAIKAQERATKRSDASALADVPLNLPALMRAVKLTKRAARIGFDWPDADSVLAKLDEEMRELAEARASADQAHIEEEFGDALFVLANLARKLDLDPEDALRKANAKFERRFRAIEAKLTARGAGAGPHDLATLDALWNEAKRDERGG